MVNPQTSDMLLERMMSLHPKVIDLTLDRVWRLLDALGNPQNALPPVVHIAGTNGKGSTQAMLRAGFEAAGKSVHAYTSPHLARFHERIRLAGKLISEPHLNRVLDECYAANGGVEITYFEITTCAALLAMARTTADLALLEVGLGGRLDATNVVDAPALTIITPVSLDHQQFLGSTLHAIATEKAGILKRGVTCVVGPQNNEALDAIELCATRVGAPLFVHGQHWMAFEERGRLIYQDENGLLDLPLPRLPGPHQIDNAGAAIAALRLLGMNDDSAEAAVAEVEWPARMQRITSGALTEIAPRAELWLDGGHNPAAGEALGRWLKRLPSRPTYIVCGMLNTKDITGYMRPLVDVATELVAVSIPGESSTLSAAETAAAARAAGHHATEGADLDTALRTIAQRAPDARILICGSLYLAGHVLRTYGPAIT